ncbi:MAG: DUF4352 domain-containing protein [Candidatus Methanoperedens sp.]|nr:DUF4352 domain-containing protein [Candidatus Methanoperedens sp.]
MVSRNKIVTTVIILLLLPVLFSGCIGEKNIAPAPDSIQKEAVNSSSQDLTQFSGCTGEKNIAPAPESIQKEAVDVSSQNLTQSSKKENMPEIKITSFSSIYKHDNSDNEDIYLFTWENVPGNQSHRLLNFLKNDFNINWAENAQISKDEDETIHIFTDENSIELRLFNDSAQSWVSSLGLWVVEENGTNNVYYKKYQNKYEICERYYAVYNLSIRNNGSDLLYFKLNNLRLYEGDRMFNTTSLEPYNKNSSLLEVLQDLEKENKLQDTTLLPGQSLNGAVAFRVNSLYNKSFLLKYNTTNVTSASFEKSIKALEAAEYFNYSVALGIPPYRNCHFGDGTKGSYEPMFDDNCDTWANWVNRSIFEAFQKSDMERMRKSTFIPYIEMVYALRVFPEKNISMFPITTQEFSTSLVAIDDKGEEMINTSRITGVAVLSDQTYASFEPRWKLIMPRMNFSNASVVRISYVGIFGWPTASRFSYNNQDIVLDKDLNIIVVRYHPFQMVS